ncbi:MAG: peptidoglycan DD-metalloendopeptidase family protein [Oscillospiraceae bacterium]|nr:peptidoglycan DD-metalloendopeptidase family protein [Oscillospiraceae bacterium]
MSNKKFGSANGKGYYIALILCAVAVGISGYLYYTSSNTEKPIQEQEAIAPTQTPEIREDVPVVATQPPKQETDPAVQPTKVPVEVVPKKMQTVSPVEGEIISVYAMDSLTYNPTTRDWRTHSGVDIAAEEGTVVRAAADGTVYTVYEDDTMGMTVVIRHEDGYVTTYSSLGQEVAVANGDSVKAGQKIGCADTTALLESAIGCHVHFGVTRDNVPVDPAEFLSQE